VDDRAIHERRLAVEDAALRVLATQQPVASDLRLLAAVQPVATDLTSIGNHARRLARLVGPLRGAAAPETPPPVWALLELDRTRLREALAAFGAATYLLLAAYDLGRVAVHTTNVCDRTVFVATGRVLETPDSMPE
jgi:phosphate uptake regulator